MCRAEEKFAWGTPDEEGDGEEKNPFDVSCVPPLPPAFAAHTYFACVCVCPCVCVCVCVMFCLYFVAVVQL